MVLRLENDRPAEMQHAVEGAAPFMRNSFMEQVIKIRAERPNSFAGLSPAAKLVLGHY